MKTKNVYGQIEDIRRQLWLGHASLMVGCGFSRNADKATPMTPIPPDWTELGDKLIEALYPKMKEDDRTAMLTQKNTPQLADEFDVVYQRPALNALLKKIIQDNNLLPSGLHVKMLELPWVDVFTTNYDTLLERAARQVTNIKYDVVLNYKDLPYSESPRIIKLHGSFPSEATHLIVSEEDYLKYPKDYSPFVNTVQQAIMETTMCLIGFSGTDPNFRKWIGWVKDNLQESMPPIYLIGLFDLSASERRVLEKRNIIPVELSELSDIQDGDYAKALDSFFSELKKQPDYYNWPQHTNQSLFAPKRNAAEDYCIEAIKQWKKERESYPHWIVLPWEKRTFMKAYTEHWAFDSISYLKNLSNTWDIEGLYELDWRMEKCLMPIFNHFIKDYEDIIGKYDPFGLKTPKNKNPDLQEKWLSLCFSVLRWSREEFQVETWNKYEKIIHQALQQKEDIYSLNRLYYEQYFFSIMLPDLERVELITKRWLEIKHPLYWKVKLGAVLYQMDEKDKAHSLWMEALNELRPNVPKSRIKDDFYLLNIEGSILYNLFLITTPNPDPEKDSIRGTKEQREQYKNRLQDLTPFGCNPWEELKRFELSLKNQEGNVGTRKEFRDFKTQRVNITFSNEWNPMYKHFQYLRFFEEAGIPFFPHKTIYYALNFISDYSPWWAFCILNIIGNGQNSSCELVFSQEKIFYFPHARINMLIEIYIRQMKHLISKKRNYLSSFFSNHYVRLADNLFEAISRLTIKAEPEKLQDVFDLGVDLYKVNNEKFLFRGLGFRYFNRLLEAMQPKQIFDNLNKLLSIPIPFPPNNEWESPSLYIEWHGFKVSPKDSTPELRETIQSLIEKLDNDNADYRSEVLHYLDACLSVGLLSDSNKKRIAMILQKYLTPPFFPQIKNFLYFAYKRFLAPLDKKIDTDDVLKKHYLQETHKIFEISEDTIRFQIMGETEFIRVSRSILATCSVFNSNEWMYFDLSSEESKSLFYNIKESLEPAKKALVKKMNDDNCVFIDAKKTIKDTFHIIDMLFGEVIVPRIKDNKTLRDIKCFVRDFNHCHCFPITSVAFMAKRNEYDEDYVVEAFSAFRESDKTIFYSYAHSICNAYRFSERKDLPTPPLHLFQALVSAVNMKSDETFRTTCGVLGNILSCYSPPDTECRVILNALGYLLKATSFEDSNERFSIQNRYDYRQSAAFLAACMYRLYQKEKREIPPELQAWYDLRESKDELPDIRNTWMEVLNNA